MKSMAADIVAILHEDRLITCNLRGVVIDSLAIRTSIGENSRIARINDCKIAVTVPSNNLIQIVTMIAPTTKTDLRTPAGTIMTGGITCRMDILYVAFSDAIRLMDLSGQIQRVITIPSVKILHSVNNDKLLCVYSKCDSDKTMSCLDFTSDSLYHFEGFPFRPEDITTDDIDNIIFYDDGAIWQADSDGKNIKMMISDHNYNQCKRLTYNKDSKILLTNPNDYGGVTLYRKLE
ncbi:unnamed protein product [Mytilus coruscus]|uniref:Uncharacterized protein n=1 Tax=Mytilus coruscus TaxID=42192 RepID=A0A6J8AVK5_MYTCO|nr:unnamed protein product [Mytilus coruscus]